MNRSVLLASIALAGLLLASCSAFGSVPEESNVPSRILPFECDQWAEQIEQLKNSEDDLERQLGALHDEPDLRYCQTRRVRVDETPDRESSRGFDIPGWLLLPELARALAIIVLTALVIWMIWRWGRYMNPRQKSEARPDAQAGAVEHAAVARPDALPEDIPGAAARAWQAGDAREAVSLLYRGAVDRLLPRRRADTEREVLGALRSRSLSDGTHRYLNELVQTWLQTAWADSPPTAQGFERLRNRWSDHCAADSERSQ